MTAVGLPPVGVDCGPTYEWVRELGHGAYGTAVLMRNRATEEMVAVKFIERGAQVDRNVEREILNHRHLSGHTNIVQYREVFLTSTHLCIAMEWCCGGMLFDRIVKMQRFKEDIARYFFQQLVCGVAWCHRQGVCHRDLKLENTLLDGRPAPRLKICDFGYSKSSVTDSTPKTTVGTPAYIAPEVFSGDTYEGEAADVWSCGVALYTMLVGAYPFQDPEHPQSAPQMVQRIIRVQYHVPPELRLSEGCLDLIRRIFVKDPAQRITLAAIRQHEWYLTNLPRECQGDGTLLQCEPPSQSEDEIRAIVKAARTPGQPQQQQQPQQQAGFPLPGGGGGGGEFNEEEHLAGLMEEEGFLE